jgi:hypothetical protein
MFALTNGKVQLKPFKVVYSATVHKVAEAGYTDEETQAYVKPVIAKEEKEMCCYFENIALASAYAEEVNGEVVNLTPAAEIVLALDTMTFSSIEEVTAFLETGVEPIQKVTIESLAEIVADIIGGAF